MRFFISIRTWIINLLLAGAAVYFGYQTYAVWSASDELDVDQLVQKPAARIVDRKVAFRRHLRYSAYDVIARKNLFASDRREQLPEKPSTPAVAVPAKPLDSRFVLFGIVIKGDRKEALVSNLDRRTATEKESIWVTVGDRIGNLNVSEIHSAQIILTQGGSTYTVHLSDQNHSQRRPSMPKKIQRSETGTINITQPKVKNSVGNGSKISS
jgi:hypothetical protein